MPRNRNQQPNRGYDPRQQQGRQNTKVKSIKPIGAGKAFALGLLAAFIIFLIAAAGLIVVSQLQTRQEQAKYNQMLSDSINQVYDASVDVAFSPANEIRQRALAPSANITVKKAVDGAAVSAANSNQNVVYDDISAPQSRDGQPAAVNQEQQSTEGEWQAESQEQASGEGQEGGEPQQSAGEVAAFSYGSGVVINSDGYVLTNYHVIQGAKDIDISIMINGVEYDKIDIMGTDLSSDLAVLKVDAKDLPVAQIGVSGNVQPGDWTMSVGNPYNLNDTMSTGIVSALDRNFTYQAGTSSVMYANMLQTTTALNEGCSGGGLYDAAGNLIGINTLVSVDEASSDRIGYAIPIDFAIPIAQQLMGGQAAAHASLGMSYTNVDNKTVEQYGLENNDGALITNITPSGPAETARIISGDIIVEYNGHHIKDAQDMLYRVRSSVINNTLPITVLRDGKKIDLTIKVGSDV